MGPDVPRLNEQALKNLADDVTFIEKEVKRLEKPGLDDVFDEIKSVRKIASPRAKSLLYGSLDDQPHSIGSDSSVHGTFYPTRIIHQRKTKKPQDRFGEARPLRGGSGKVHDGRCLADE